MAISNVTTMDMAIVVVSIIEGNLLIFGFSKVLSFWINNRYGIIVLIIQLIISRADIQGPKGETGATGERGEKGDTGERGETGERGQPGEAGQPGKDGAPGQSGEPGQNGTPGGPGETGANGEPGNPGNPGERGIIHTLNIVS